MMDTTLKEQRLPAGFTFNIVEMVKRIRIHPITQSKGLPWGLSLATGVIITIFCLNPYMPYFSQLDTPAGAPLPADDMPHHRTINCLDLDLILWYYFNPENPCP